MKAPILAAGLLLALARPALAADIALPFAPPLDRALRYGIEQDRPVEGKESRFSAVRDLRFERDGDGYVLHATLRSIDSDAPDSGADSYRAALGPLLGVEHRFRLDAAGRIVALDNMDAVWAAVQAGLEKMRDGLAPGSNRRRAADTVQAFFAGLSPDSRLALLAGELQPLFLFASGEVADGAGRGVKTVAGSPLGRPVPVEGILRVERQSPERIDLAEDLAGQGVRLTVHYGVSRVTGLVETQRRELEMGPRLLRETRVLTAVP